MKALAYVLVGLVTLVILFFVGTLFLPGNYHVERSITINATPAQIFPEINKLRNWPKWMVWSQRDPQMVIQWEGPQSGVGAVQKWESDSEGSGELTITTSVENSAVGYDLYFPEHKTTSYGQLSLEVVEPEGSHRATIHTKVVWSDHGEFNGPIGKMFVLFIDSMVGPDFEAGLKNMKALCEAKPALTEPANSSKAEGDSGDDREPELDAEGQAEESGGN